MIAGGSEFIPYLEELNREYRRLNITIGGVADMVGIAFGCLLAEGVIAPGEELLAAQIGSAQLLDPI